MVSVNVAEQRVEACVVFDGEEGILKIYSRFWKTDVAFVGAERVLVRSYEEGDAVTGGAEPRGCDGEGEDRGERRGVVRLRVNEWNWVGVESSSDAIERGQRRRSGGKASREFLSENDGGVLEESIAEQGYVVVWREGKDGKMEVEEGQQDGDPDEKMR